MYLLEGNLKTGVAEFLKNIELLSDRYGVIQAVDGDFCASKEHVEFAVDKAVTSMNSGRQIARNLGVEILCYLSATRQIKKALSISLGESTKRVVVIFFDKRARAELAELIEVVPTVGFSKDKVPILQSWFEVTDAELEIMGIDRLPLLVKERVVLMDLFKK